MLALILLLYVAPARSATTITGAVERWIDGDTVAVVAARCVGERCPVERRIIVRVAAIDAPEHDQPFGREARSAAEFACPRGHDATIALRPGASYGRLIGSVRCGTLDVGETLARAGLAWRYRWARGDDVPAIDALVAEARRARRGLWSDPRPVEPRMWRNGQR